MHPNKILVYFVIEHIDTTTLHTISIYKKVNSRKFAYVCQLRQNEPSEVMLSAVIAGQLGKQASVRQRTGGSVGGLGGGARDAGARTGGCGGG